MQIKPLGGHRRITIMGLGLFGGGLGAARFWRSVGCEVTVTDLRSEQELGEAVHELRESGVRLVLGRHEAEDFAQADLVMVNPAVKPGNKYVNIAREAGAVLQTEIGLAISLHRGPVLAVTGSNGKSTTTALLGKIVQQHNPAALIGGNIGGSVLENLKGHLPSAPLVLELSSFQLHYLKAQKFAPDVAVVTNLSPNHLDWHNTVLHYYESKRNLLAFQNDTQYAILFHGDPVLRDWGESAAARVIWTSPDDPGTDCACFVREGEIVARLAGEERALVPLSALRLPGAHNVLNALQAAAAGFAFTRAPVAVTQGIAEFGGLPHRLELVAERGGLRFINDSIATTPESAVCGLRSFQEPVVIIAGGYDKEISLAALAQEIARKAAGFVLIGQTAQQLLELIRRENPGAEPVYMGTDFAQAIDSAARACPAGGVVLLSPGCASYGMFVNFQERGERFAAHARTLNI